MFTIVNYATTSCLLVSCENDLTQGLLPNSPISASRIIDKDKLGYGLDYRDN